MTNEIASRRKLLIADDHDRTRAGLRKMIEGEPTLYVGGEACDGEEALSRVRAEPWDLVLLDITMPRKSGLDVLRAVHEEFPQLPVIILSAHSSAQYMDRTLKMGARGYVMKDEAVEKLLPSVLEILSLPH